MKNCKVRSRMRLVHKAQPTPDWAVLFVGMVTVASGCASRSSPASTSSTASPQATNVQFNDRQIISEFANQVVVPTNQLFAKRAAELSSAVSVFVENPNNQTVKAAQSAWVAARSPWEQSE